MYERNMSLLSKVAKGEIPLRKPKTDQEIKEESIKKQSIEELEKMFNAPVSLNEARDPKEILAEAESLFKK